MIHSYINKKNIRYNYYKRKDGSFSTTNVITKTAVRDHG